MSLVDDRVCAIRKENVVLHRSKRDADYFHLQYSWLAFDTMPLLPLRTGYFGLESLGQKKHPALRAHALMGAVY
jgi:hypothetical protein